MGGRMDSLEQMGEGTNKARMDGWSRMDRGTNGRSIDGLSMVHGWAQHRPTPRRTNHSFTDRRTSEQVVSHESSARHSLLVISELPGFRRTSCEPCNVTTHCACTELLTKSDAELNSHVQCNLRLKWYGAVPLIDMFMELSWHKRWNNTQKKKDEIVVFVGWILKLPYHTWNTVHSARC